VEEVIFSMKEDSFDLELGVVEQDAVNLNKYVFINNIIYIHRLF